MLEYIFIAFVVIFSIQLCYYLLVFGKFSFLKKDSSKDSNKFPISIIICAKNEVANNKNTAICFSENAFTISEPKETFKDWFQQKRRQVSVSSLYKKKHKFLLGLFYISQLLFYTPLILLLSFQYKWVIVTLLIAFRLIVLYIVIGFSAKKLKEIDLIVFSPFYEILLIFTQMLIFIKNLISKPTNW